MKKKLTIVFGWLVLFLGMLQAQAQSLNAWEYWFNDDHAGRVTTNIGAVTRFTLSADIPAATLPAGLHTLHIRFRDTEGRWSTPLSHLFFKGGQHVAAFEYWFNEDSENKTTQTANNASEFTMVSGISTDALEAGMHTLHIRFRDGDGKWSAPLSHRFFKGGQHVAAFEYWFNDDVDSKTTLAANNAADFVLTANISTDDLDPGMHQMHCRFVDAGGVYSQVESRRFWKSGQTLTEFVYWFDDNIAEAVAGDMPGTVSETWLREINVGRGLNFDHMHVRYLDASNYWSSVLTLEAPPPLADFFTLNDRYFMTFNNTTKLGKEFEWDLGDGTVSDKVNPSHTYDGPGEYDVCLIAKNNMGSDTLCHMLTLRGIASVNPDRAGNGGRSTIGVFGGGFTADAKVSLRREGHDEIVADTTFLEYPGKLQARLNLRGRAIGQWDLVVTIPGDTTLILEAGFTIEVGRPPDVWAEITGRDVVLVNRWQTYTISYGNRGNNDARVVPMWLVISDVEGLEVEFVSAKPDIPIDADDLWETIQKEVPLHFKVDTLNDEPHKARVYPFVFPEVPPYVKKEITIRIKSPRNIRVVVWINKEQADEEDDNGDPDPGDLPPASPDYDECVRWALSKAYFAGLTTLLEHEKPTVDCYAGITYSILNHGYYTATFGSVAYSLARAAMDCVAGVDGSLSVAKAWELGQVVLKLAGDMYDLYEAVEACKRAFEPVAFTEIPIRTVTSFDPNEIVGPRGYTDKNYNFDDITFPYIIYFENLDDATAPAQEVFVYDTLDVSKFDLSTFEFGNIGFGDTIIFVEPGLKSYTNDIDLRPDKDIILRINGRLDTLSGVVKWSFVSLDPATMDLTEDPFGGFLPPNINGPEGEGFVSFSIRLKEGLQHATVIENQATIIFDLNKPISTNVWVNAIDREPPVSAVDPLGDEAFPQFLVSWDGYDANSGIKHYSVYYSKDGGEPVLWKLNTRHKNDLFYGEVGSVYRFYSEATDSIGNQEFKSGIYDTGTTVVVSARMKDKPVINFNVYPNPARDVLHVSYQFDAPKDMWFVVYDVFGREHIRRFLKKADRQDQSFSVEISLWDKGVYFCVMESSEGRVVRKLVIN